MKIQRFMWLLTIMLILLQHQPVALSSPIHLTPTMQKIALFQFKLSLAITTPTNCSSYSDSNNHADSNNHVIQSYPKTIGWNMSSDYCTWEGVTCEHNTADIIGLDLTCSQLEGSIHPNSTLFQLSHLRFLNLSWNDFSLSGQFPKEFGIFAEGLTHLNLSNTGFPGRVPSEISHLYNLVSLDLNHNDDANLEGEDFKSLLHNLTQLRVLNLQWVDISSVLPANFSASLRVLNLVGTGLHSLLPQEVFHLPNIEVLVLCSNSINLTATLPKVKWGSSSSLQYLNLGGINLNGGIPDSIAFLQSLTSLELFGCNLYGTIPRTARNLSQLTYLDLSLNHLAGQIPALISNLTNLRVLSLSYNNFTGQLPSWVSHLRELYRVDLSYNSLSGPLPPRLFDLPLLKALNVAFNGFTGRLHEFDTSKSQLESFDCIHNSLTGPIPQSFSQLLEISRLDFSSNNFSGVLDIEMFSRLEHLEYLDLSHNSLSVKIISMVTLPPKLHHLGLSSCKLKDFPHFSANTEYIEHLDLSNNQIDGKIPQWIGSVGWSSYSNLNLSHNRLIGGLEQLPWNNVGNLDLQTNMLNESVPTSICNSSSLDILNLSHNNLGGVLPICRKSLTHLSVFDLRMNNIKGILPPTLSNFRNLQSLNLHGNRLEGRIPSSFAELSFLETLDLGSNQIEDTFPQCLEALPNLQVLILKSNKFHGIINKSSKIDHPFPSLRIIDLSYNEFAGPLPAIYFKNFKAMMDGNVNEIELSYMGNYYYKDSTGLVIKGVEIELGKILTMFTTIDLSGNNFEGEIVEHIGNLLSLRFLNLSHNRLTGHIPSSFGKLSMLESLDLSFNRLEGEIPQQLTSINSLARLNLSCNQLRGHIPQGPQFNTFENDSYVGNFGLCGHPLSRKCENDIGTKEEEEDEDEEYLFNGFTWEAVAIGYGCGVVPAFIIGYLMLLAGKPKWYAGIIARELGLKIRRMEITTR